MARSATRLLPNGSPGRRTNLHSGMKLVMTLLVRDEADIVDAQIAYHLDAGVDFVVATDNRSEDETTEILERYARDGVLHLIREPGDDLRQSEWVTRMARLAATDFGADWIVNADADEFWLARGATLKELLAAVPSRFGAVRGAWRNFVPRPDDERLFTERMTARLCTPSFHPHPLSTHFKSAHRARADVRIGRGNHEALADDLVALRGWYPIEILHFPVRSYEQCRRKYVTQFVALERNAEKGIPGHMAEAYEAYRAGRLDAFYAPLVVDDEALDAGLAAGTYAIDTRLRDTLRLLGFGGADESARPRRRPRPRRSRRQRSSRASTRRSVSPISAPRSATGSMTSRLGSAGWSRAPPRVCAASREACARDRIRRPRHGARSDQEGRSRPLRGRALRLLVPGARLADGEGAGHLGLPRLLPPVLRLQAPAVAGAALPRPAHAARRRAADGPRRKRPARGRLRAALRRLGGCVERDRAHLRACSRRSPPHCCSSSIRPGRPSITRRRATPCSPRASRSGRSCSRGR